MAEGGSSPETSLAYSASRSEWLLNTRPAGIDPEKFILGEALGNIIADDGNCFYWYQPMLYQGREDRFRTGARQMQSEYQWRLLEEIKAPGLPQEIKDKLVTTLDAVKSSDWSDQESFIRAFDNWHVLQGEVQEKIAANSVLKDSTLYHRQMNEQIDKLYIASRSKH